MKRGIWISAARFNTLPLLLLQLTKPTRTCQRRSTNSPCQGATWWVYTQPFFSGTLYISTRPLSIWLYLNETLRHNIVKHPRVIFNRRHLWQQTHTCYFCVRFGRRRIKRLRAWSACSPWPTWLASPPPWRKRSSWESNFLLSSWTKWNR